MFHQLSGSFEFLFTLILPPDMHNILWETSKRPRIVLNEASNLILEMLA